MGKKTMLVSLAVILGLLAIFAYSSEYELRFVPNKPYLRPEKNVPAPDELGDKFELKGGSERDNRGFPQRKIEDLASQYPKLFYREGPRNVKKVALTFDDGPDSVYTPQILDVLRKHKVKATFFLVGERAELFPDVVKKIVKGGHVIGNHSMTHPNIMKLNKEQTFQEIQKCEDVLSALTGYKPALFRSPYGSLDSQKVEEISELDVKLIAWNIDSLDWKSLTAEQVKANILENVREGSIILQHSSGSKKENLTGSVAALDEVIKTLKKEKYKFVTVSELLDIPYKK
ncbi:MAG TPA: polysaccharide deacetylase family protein [Clostridia bacterium]|jgi:polysaccharide deacetylase family sporulation protein PdaB|nr:polysaccharide deacetylase family protein [Clostridia bacterium]HHY06752.1 polysaccharide deacetylase family protein [Clostridia bacterium]